ncbi:MAG: hypothetical protein U0441_27710 [Polyangiaceae bacterium]
MSGAPGLDTVEGFAALSASLDDPFADRTRLLDAAGLDETGFAELSEHWLARLGADNPEGLALVERFAFAYSQRTRETHRIQAARPSEPSAPVPPAVPSPAPPPPLPIESPSAAPARVEMPSFLKATPATTPTPQLPVVPATPSFATAPEARLPFAAASSTPLSSGTSDVDLSKVLAGLAAKMPFDPSKPSVASVPSLGPRSGTPLSGETVDVNVAELARKALSAGPPGKPVVAAPAPAPAAPAPATSSLPTGDAPAAPPGKRLVWFDPQTGQRLATPQWEDLPPSPGAPPAKGR